MFAAIGLPRLVRIGASGSARRRFSRGSAFWAAFSSTVPSAMMGLGAVRRIAHSRRSPPQCSSPTEADMPLIAALVFLLALTPSTALAQEIPEYDSQAHCERVAESAAQPSAALGRCLWLEEYALDELETFWPRASDAMREECLEIASAEESYVVLARCVMARLRRSR